MSLPPLRAQTLTIFSPIRHDNRTIHIRCYTIDCGKTTEAQNPFLVCVSCMARTYCSERCANHDLPSHKRHCRQGIRGDIENIVEDHKTIFHALAISQSSSDPSSMPVFPEDFRRRAFRDSAVVTFQKRRLLDFQGVAFHDFYFQRVIGHPNDTFDSPDDLLGRLMRGDPKTALFAHVQSDTTSGWVDDYFPFYFPLDNASILRLNDPPYDWQEFLRKRTGWYIGQAVTEDIVEEDVCDWV